MNNLLRSLRSGGLGDGTDSELTALLSDVREARAHDSKVIDQFYDSLEGLLSELRMVTMDNRDAEAFLKPVSRAEVPDYFDVIAHPMDLQTMLKKVKAKQYKSKLEFSDDLNLIWENCLRYNSTPDHPLRACALRLRDKASVLLARVTDRTERQAPRVVPALNGALPSPPSSNEDHPDHRPLLNGKLKSSLNGKAIIKVKVKDKERTPLPIKIPPLQSAARPGSRPPALTKGPSQTQSGSQTPKPATPHAMSFEERSALVRSQESMAQYTELDRRLDEFLELQDSQRPKSLGAGEASQVSQQSGDTWARASNLGHILTRRFKTLTEAEVEKESEQIASGPWTSKSSITSFDFAASPVKRKRSPSLATEELDPSRKKIKVEPVEGNLPLEPPAFPQTDPLNSVLDLWWKAVGTNTMIASAVPGIVQPIPYPPAPTPPRREKGKGTAKRKRDRVVKMEVDQSPMKPATTTKRKRAKNEKSLLHLMNRNITTLRKLRNTHFKYSQLTRDVEMKDGAAGGDAGDAQGQPAGDPPAAVPLQLEAPAAEMSEQAIKANERGWKVRGEVGEQEAVECYTWMCNKVLQHSTFQGTSTVALQHMTDITIQYISNVGRTLRLMMDRHGQKMSPEELILHTLFENGLPSVSDLEYYIKDDVLRHGARLQDAEKKLNGALQELINADSIDDDNVFGENVDDDHFSSGMFGDILGEDYLGLEASGVLSEIGLPSLSIPRRLWKGKKPGETGPGAGNKNEPKLPFPPPPPFVPLRSDKVDEQIGLVQGYFRDRFTALAAPPSDTTGSIPGAPVDGSTSNVIPKIAVQPPTTPTAPTTVIPPHPVILPPGADALAPPNPYPLAAPPPSEPLFLLDDTPDPIRSKLGPIGQIILPSANALAMKKKKDRKEGIVAPAAAGSEKPTPTEKPSKPAGSSKKAAPKEKTPKETSAAPTSKKKKAPSAAANGGTPSPSKKSGGGSKSKASAPKATALVPPV